jgi:hypothetical protein
MPEEEKPTRAKRVAEAEAENEEEEMPAPKKRTPRKAVSAKK